MWSTRLQIMYTMSSQRSLLSLSRGGLEWIGGRRCLVSTSNVAAGSSSLHSEWLDLAKKQLKGKDPQETLTWNTPEVS